ncbi:MAG TPA: type IV pilin protein [Burkholderiaceae bacterium]|nr:type IV pilin protein [Burkholderiaceae bacterium]
MRRPPGGFTLIELMIVVAVVAILAMIAYPSYRESVLKGRRAEGRTALAELLQQQERYMTQANTYYRIAPAGQEGTPFKTFSGSNRESSAYKLGAEACNSSVITECVRVYAKPVQDDPLVGTLEMTSTGSRGCSGTAGTTDPSLCWR